MEGASRVTLDAMNRALIRTGKLGGLYTPVLDAAHERTRQIIERGFAGTTVNPQRVLKTPEAQKIVRAAGERAVEIEAMKARSMAAGLAAIEAEQNKKPN
jgi:hypothetical protein